MGSGQVIRSSTVSVFFSLLLLLLLLVLVLLHGGRIQPIHSEKRMYKLCVEMTCIVVNLRTHSTCLFCWSDLECDIFSDVLLLYFQPKTKECGSMHTHHLLPFVTIGIICSGGGVHEEGFQIVRLVNCCQQDLFVGLFLCFK